MIYFILSKRLLAALLLSVGLLFSITTFPQVTRQWARLFDDLPNSWNQAIAMVADDAGNVYVTGQSSGNNNWDIVTIKYNGSGTQEWVVRYDGFHGVDYPIAITIDKSGNIYVSGGSEGNGTLDDVVTIKYNNAGIQQWLVRYNGPDNSSEHAFGNHSIKVDNNGNVYVLGMALAKNNKEDYVTIKYNSMGVQQWAQYYNGPGNGRDWAHAMALDPITADVYVTGFTELGNSLTAYATIKYNSAGVQQWVRTYGSYVGGAIAIGLDAQGNVYVTGHSVSFSDVTGTVTIKYSALGEQQWTARYDAPANASSSPMSMGIDRFGNTYITGSSWVPIPGTYPQQYKSTCFTLKYNSDGIQQWVQLRSGTGNISTEGTALTLDDEGNVYVTGYTDSSSAHFNRNYTTIKYNPEGIQQWIEHYDAFGSNDDPVDITVNKFDDVFVTGTVDRQLDVNHINFHYLTVKYIQPKPLLVTSSADTTVYYGYGSNCVQLNADVSGGEAPYTFTWLPGGSTPNKSSTTVCPTSTTVFEVIVRDALGTADTAQVTVKVIDVRCEDKVIVCHNGKELCIASQAVDAHLQHGDKLGSCLLNSSDCDKLNDISALKGITPFIFKAYPNPFSNETSITYQIPLDAQVSITLLDLNGREISTLVREKKKAGYYVVPVNAKKLIAGTYLCRMVISSPPCQEVYTLKLIVAK